MRISPDGTRRAGAAAVLAGSFLVSGVARAADDSGVKLPQLDIQTYPSQIFWLVVSFAVLYVLVSKVAVPRIFEVLEERQERIADDLDKAQTLQSEAAQAQADHEALLAEARARAAAAVREAQDAAARAGAEREEAARARVAEMVAEAERRIAASRAGAVENIRDVASEAAVEAVARLIGSRPGEDAVTRAIGAVAQDGGP